MDIGSLKILIVEDDQCQADIFRRWLGRHSAPAFESTIVSTLSSAREALAERRYDAVLLDRTLNDGDGMALLQAIRRSKTLRDLPVLVVSGLQTDREVAAGLTCGADEYMTKPVALEIFSARLLAVLRRCRPELSDANVLEGAGFQLDTSGGRLMIEGRVERLEPKETALLAVFLRRPNVIHTADSLRELAWGDSDQARNTLEARLHTLRRKLGVHAARLETIRGQGYRFLL